VITVIKWTGYGWRGKKYAWKERKLISKYWKREKNTRNEKQNEIKCGKC
jgi:hypothetical protein